MITLPWPRAAAALAMWAMPGCASAPYVWIEQLPQQHAADEYAITPGDVVAVRVFGQESLSTRARVRSDGKIAVPMIGDVGLGGRTPAVVSKELGVRFKEFVVAPSVMVTVEEPHATTVSVLGEVGKPGIYPLDGSAPGVLQALAAAGGLTEFASGDSIYVVRRGEATRIRFSFSSLSRGGGRASAFRLQAGDAVVVE